MSATRILCENRYVTQPKRSKAIAAHKLGRDVLPRAVAHARNRRDFLLRACRILLCVRVIHEDLCLVEWASV
jgi:hypothetical protein